MKTVSNNIVTAYVLFVADEASRKGVVRNRSFTLNEFSIDSAANTVTNWYVQNCIARGITEEYALRDVIDIFPATDIGRKRAAEIKRAYKAGEWTPINNNVAVAAAVVEENSVEAVEAVATVEGETVEDFNNFVESLENKTFDVVVTPTAMHAIETLESVFA